MALSRTAWQTAIDGTSTTAQYALGTLREHQHPTFGPQIYRYVLSRGALTAGLGCMQENGTDKYEVILSGTTTPACKFMGVVVTPLPTGTYGWVLCDGFGAGFVSDGTTTANAGQTCAANGQFTDTTLGGTETMLLASITEDPAGAGGLFSGYVRAL